MHVENSVLLYADLQGISDALLWFEDSLSEEVMFTPLSSIEQCVHAKWDVQLYVKVHLS